LRILYQVQIAESLRLEQPHLRRARLVVMLTRINAFLSSHPVYIPFGNSQEDVRQVLFDTVVGLV